MAIYTTFVEPEDRPNLKNHVAVYAVVDDTTEHIMAYCMSSHDAEYLKALIVYYGGQLNYDVLRKLPPAK